jgi:hypothetical protein
MISLVSYTLVSIGEELKACMSSHDLGMELAVVVQANGGTNYMSTWVLH